MVNVTDFCHVPEWFTLGYTDREVPAAQRSYIYWFTMTTETEQSVVTDTIRRMIRVLGAMPAHVGNPDAVERAARFVHDRLKRTQERVIWFAPEDRSPLVVAGSGPILLATYMDDTDPYASSHSGQPPSFRESFVSGPGIIRKAGVVAAVAAQMSDDFSDLFTLVIETDRNLGSRSLEAWMKTHPTTFSAGIWEATDLPMISPAIIHSAPGRISMKVVTHTNHHYAESHYGSVVTDLGLALARAISELVSRDHEVLLENFYDGVDTADQTSVDTLHDLESRTEAWLQRVAPGDVTMPAAHLTMGVYLTPSIVVRELRLPDPNPYLPVTCEATIDLHLVPGQNATVVARTAIAHFKERLPGVSVEILLMRPPVIGKANIAALREAYPHVLRTVPSISPAGLIESHGIPTVGYAAVARNPENTSGRVALEEVVNGARLVQELARRMTSDAAPPTV